jgi:putative FmdB family regulatory protein
MPLYEYQCDACAHRFEVIQKFSDAPIDVCPKCGGVVKKLLSSPAIQFKGTGWYITDYARSGKTDSATTKASSESKSETKSESKPETKTETAKPESKPSSSA